MKTEIDLVVIFSIAIVMGIVALLFAAILALRITKAPTGNKKIEAIGESIKIGASAFLKREYKTLIPFVLLIFVILWFFIDFKQYDTYFPKTSLSFIFGALTSGLAGFIGMTIAVRANVRTTASAMTSLNQALRIAFSSGSVMGLTVVGLGLLGITILYWIFQDIRFVAGFGLGASSIALFSRVGGGIYTKAADVGADLVGKVEAGIPEDDPRNPAVIADNVGDNVGDVAGMGADLFESYAGAIIATITLAAVSGATLSTLNQESMGYVLIPILVATGGIVASMLGTLVVRTKEKADFGNLLWSLRRGIYTSAILVIILALAGILILNLDFRIFWIILTGLIAGIIIGNTTEYYTSYNYKPTQKIAEASQTGAATIILQGISTGMQSTLIPIIVIGTGILLSYTLGSSINSNLGFYAIALAGVGMLSTLGITLATDAYGPVADNAGGIAEQSNLKEEVRTRTDTLDALGNTTAATGKGFAIGSAALTALALLAAYAQLAEIKTVDLLQVKTAVGLLFGAMLPFLFSAMTINAVGRAAFAIVNEVRRQFREIPGIMKGTASPDYVKCVEISTTGSLKEMILPGILAIVAPLFIGFLLGVEALAGLLFGSVASGFLLAVTMSNSGGAWDNAKKYIELGNFGGKGSESHKAGVTGDVVGDPFKDTSGPSLNILIKLMSIVSLVFAPLLLQVGSLIK